MLTYSLTEKGVPLYEQLYRHIKEDILTQKLKAGEKLPSKRELAQHLSISKVTVEAAYSQLMAEGYIYSIEKKGYFTDKIDLMLPKKEPYQKNEKKVEKEEKNLIADFTQNSAEPETFPFTVWNRLMRETTADNSRDLLKPISSQGTEILRKAIAEYLYRGRGLEANPDNIVIGAGTEYLYNLLIQLLGNDKLYAYENPCHKKIVQIYDAAGVKSVPIEMNKNGVNIKKLEESGADIIHLSPSHHFPTGTVMPIGKRRDVLNYVYQHKNGYIFEDDYDCEFRYVGKPVPTLKSTDTLDAVIYMNTFSKSLAPSIRISYMILPDRLMNLFREKLGFYSCTVSSFEQYTLAEFIRQGYFEKHLNRMKKYYREKRDYILSALSKSDFGSKINISEEDAGLHFLLGLDTVKSDKEICKSCLSAGIKISALSEYNFGKEDISTHKFVINYSGVSKEQIDKAIKEAEKLFK